MKDPTKHSLFLEISEQNLEESLADICKNMLIIKNLSPRIMAIKFLSQKPSTKTTEPLQINMSNSDIYQFLLFKINRLKFHKYRVEENDKEWHSFDEKMKQEHKK